MGAALQSTDALNKLEDLSGIHVNPGENPYDALIRACRDDPVCLVSRCLSNRAWPVIEASQPCRVVFSHVE